MKFLVNPPRKARGSNPGDTRANKGGRRMAKRKTPPRYKSGPKKGQFKPRSARKRNPTTRKTKRRSSSSSSRRRSTPRRASRRRNPDLVQQLLGGVVDAAEIVAGKAATRVIPPLLKLPTTGNTGLAVQIAAAVALGYVADMAFGANVGRNVLAGALSAPLESVVVAANVPYVSAALITPVPGTGTTAGYSGRRDPVRAYFPPTSRRALPAPRNRGAVGSWVTSPPGSGVSFM